jgi:hypothetical protein
MSDVGAGSDGLVLIGGVSNSNTISCMHKIAKIVEYSAIGFSIVVILFFSYDRYRHGKEKHLIAWFSSAGFVLLTFPISMRLIIAHLTHWYQPNVQKYVVRIILMVPIYSIESWFALRFKSYAMLLGNLRECYEAYVIYSFLYYLITLLGEEVHLVSKLRDKPKDRGQHVFPFSYIAHPWICGSDYLHKCKVGVLQYVVIKNISAIIITVLESYSMYDEGIFRFDKGYLYMCMLNNSSQLWAFYCLAKFYFTMKEELQVILQTKVYMQMKDLFLSFIVELYLVI